VLKGFGFEKQTWNIPGAKVHTEKKKISLHINPCVRVCPPKSRRYCVLLK